MIEDIVVGYSIGFVVVLIYYGVRSLLDRYQDWRRSAYWKRWIEGKE